MIRTLVLCNIIFASTFTLSCTQEGSNKNPPTKQEILAVTEKYNHTWELLDADKISSFHAEDFRYYYRGTPASTKEQYDKLLRTEILPTMSKWKMAVINPFVKLLGNDSAIISFTITSEMLLADGKPYDYGSGAFTYVWERRKNKWKIVHIHESALEKKE